MPETLTFLPSLTMVGETLAVSVVAAAVALGDGLGDGDV